MKIERAAVAVFVDVVVVITAVVVVLAVVVDFKDVKGLSVR